MPQHLSEENRELQLAVQELRVLNDIATTVSSIQSVDQIIEQIVFKCIKHLQVEEGTISLLQDESMDRKFRTMIRRRDTSATRVPMKLDDRLTGWMLKHKSTLLSNDIHQDDRFHFLDDASYNFTSILCVPLMVKGNLTGYLAVFNKKGGKTFNQQDRRLLSIIASQSAQVIENARLYEEEKALLGLQEEMRMARDIQLNLLPGEMPVMPGYDISATNIPAKSVGGDYYDFISFSESVAGLCIGDITGKGMPAAMLMANLQATFRSHALMYADCCQCLQGTNTLLFKSTEPTKFATLFYGILDGSTDTLEYVNAGHDAPLFFKNGDDPAALNATGLLMGVMEHTSYTKDEVIFEEGDILLLYTDGITEAMNPDNQEYELERVIQTVRQHRHQSAQELQNALINNVKAHSEGASQSDDITLMVIKKSPT